MLSDLKPNTHFVLDNKRMQKAINYVTGYKIGEEAHHSGVSMRNCPLDRLDPMRKGWRRGWKNANRVNRMINIPIHTQIARTPFQNDMLKLYKIPTIK